MSLTVRERLERTEDRLRYLKEKFPYWRVEGPGNAVPEYRREIQRLEEERQKLALRIARRYGQATARKEGTLANVKSAIAQNIEKLRRECGWSFDQLAAKTGIDKKLVLSHVQGKHRPVPRTQREYAQAFSKELNRPITANDLGE